MDARELRERAAAEAAELRPIPADVREREMWAEERRPYDLAVAQVRTQLGEKEFEQARAEGRAMSMEEAIEYALNGSVSSQS